MRPSFPTPQCLQQLCHPSKFHPRTKRIQKNNPGKTFFPTWWILDWSFAVIVWYSTSEPKRNDRSFEWFPKTSHVGSSRQTRDLESFAHRYSIPWNLPHQFSSRPDRNNMAEVPSFTLRTALSAIPLVSDLCGVEVQWFQERSSHAKFQGIVSVNDFRIPIRPQELLQAPLCFLRSFCFARIRLDPLSGWVATRFSPQLDILSQRECVDKSAQG